ncbi:MAG: OmpA family protein [Bauldia sp.]
MATLQASLDTANGTIASLNGKVDQLTAALTDSGQKIDTLNGNIAQLDTALADASAKNVALAAALTDANAKNDALSASLAAANQKIDDLNTALCTATDKVVALTNRLDPYRLEFVAGLKPIFAGNQNVFFDGDRVIVASEVLFPTASAELNASGKDTITKVADFLKEFAPKFPADLKWALQVNGYTDDRPIHTRKFPSNWELSTARALSVVELLGKSVPGENLIAAGFGQYQPLATGNDPEVLHHNRRIEMEITDNGLVGVTSPALPTPASSCAPKS